MFLRNNRWFDGFASFLTWKTSKYFLYLKILCMFSFDTCSFSVCIDYSYAELSLFWQWDNITNTVWWQDFPRRTTADYSDLFRGIEELKTDFAAQLAGFVSSLLVDVPSQAHWINELAMYDFGQAACHLVASLPGIHFPSSYLVADYSSTVSYCRASWYKFSL